jgi:phosphopantothenoylcysteine decarboxylase / phosphopantothenate---cysteine ligase
MQGKKIILGVTGSIAAYKAAQIASGLVKRGAQVHVVMTQNARKLVGEATFWALTRNPVLCEMFEPSVTSDIEHVSVAESADLLLVAPATANTIAKLAVGMADDMLSTMALVARCPMLIAPAMNRLMFRHKAVQENLARLRDKGWVIIEPESGRLACGDEGIGRLADPEAIIERVGQTLAGAQGDLSGLRIMVSAGPTQEAIDPVRVITNRSSGKMGYAIAERAIARGASVVLVSGPVGLSAPESAKIVCVSTVAEMREAVVSRIGEVDAFVSAAAPADFVPAEPENSKIKKRERLSLELVKAVDILGDLGGLEHTALLVGFAAETEDVVANARAKLESKNLDIIVANDARCALGADDNEVTIIDRSGFEERLPRMSKAAVADKLLDHIAETVRKGMQ